MQFAVAPVSMRAFHLRPSPAGVQAFCRSLRWNEAALCQLLCVYTAKLWLLFFSSSSSSSSSSPLSSDSLLLDRPSSAIADALAFHTPWILGRSELLMIVILHQAALLSFLWQLDIGRRSTRNKTSPFPLPPKQQSSSSSSSSCFSLATSPVTSPIDVCTLWMYPGRRRKDSPLQRLIDRCHHLLQSPCFLTRESDLASGLNVTQSPALCDQLLAAMPVML